MTTPRSESLTRRILTWLEQHPDEVLTFDDAATKFNASRVAIKNAIHHLRRLGQVRTDVVLMLDSERHL
jgi:response regulator of citrate/malate metabolism